MAKKCPLTGDMALYLDCLECDSKKDCKAGKIHGNIPKQESVKKNHHEEKAYVKKEENVRS